ncbi:MAG: hypothetical protein GYA74_11570, partial [Acidobacteria bacterium]|nr:hypothetical protein [Acidobacteriota bacterium]
QRLVIKDTKNLELFPVFFEALFISAVESEGYEISDRRAFIARFDALESRLAENGTPLGEATMDEMEAAWQALKKERG